MNRPSANHQMFRKLAGGKGTEVIRYFWRVRFHGVGNSSPSTKKQAKGKKVKTGVEEVGRVEASEYQL
jgi:hypothetical protein